VHILDSSAIAVILRRLGKKAVEAIGEKTTLDLARYELGNIVWKECILKSLITPDEAMSRAEEIAKILAIMRVELVETGEDFMEVMRLSTELKITFYDASYLYMAKKNNLTLITEDVELKGKAKGITLAVISVSQFLNQNSRPSYPTRTKH